MSEVDHLRLSFGEPNFIDGAITDILTEWQAKIAYSYHDGGTIESRLSSIQSRFPLTPGIIIDNYYHNVCDIIVNGGSVLGSGFQLQTQVRDCCGFCVPTSLDSTEVYYRGFTNNRHRPGILIQKTVNIDYPRGNSRCMLPSKTKVILPEGSYFVDAEVFDTILTGQTLYTLTPSQGSQVHKSR